MPSINAQALYSACYYGDAAAVSRLLPAGGTPRNLSGPSYQRPVNKYTPLTAAAMGGHTEIVRLILDRAPNTAVDHATAIGDTAATVAAQYYHVETLQLLADRGANINVVGKLRSTPLRLAVGRINVDDPQQRDPDPKGARQLTTARALLRLGAGTQPSATPPF
jgi:ankyrin repeat protein